MKMIPPEVDRTNPKRRAEADVFDILTRLNGPDYADVVCLHSVGIARHYFEGKPYGKLYGEADFVLVGPRGVMVLEVKGGNVSYNQNTGEWTFGRTKKKESPFEQVNNAAHSIKREIEEQLGISNIAIAPGVIFPDIQFNAQSIEWGSWPIYDARPGRPQFSQYLEQLWEYWEGRGKKPKRMLSAAEVEKIVNYLRPNFDFPIPLQNVFKQQEQERQRFTEGQCRCLDGLRRSPRVLVQGCAGSGKTMIAIDRACAMATEGKKILFICFNRLLASWIQAEIKARKLSDAIHVRSLYKFMKDISEQESALESTGDTKTFFDKLPSAFSVAVEKLSPSYDALLLDEAQDYLTPTIINGLGALLHGGISNGTWNLFYDPNQTLWPERFDSSFLESLQRDYSTVTYELQDNCRNTSTIISTTRILTDLDLDRATIRDLGSKVEFAAYESDSSLESVLIEKLRYLKAEKITSRNIVVLYPENRLAKVVEKACAFEELSCMNVDDFPFGKSNKDTILHHTISGYKGLESSVVIFLGVNEFLADERRAMNYVAMTRAKDLLIVLFHTSTQGQIQILNERSRSKNGEAAL